MGRSKKRMLIYRRGSLSLALARVVLTNNSPRSKSLKVENKGIFLSECKCNFSSQARAGGVLGDFTNLLDKASLGVKAMSSPFWLKSELEPKGAPLKFFLP